MKATKLLKTTNLLKEKEKIRWTTLKLRTSIHQKILLREQKDIPNTSF